MAIMMEKPAAEVRATLAQEERLRAQYGDGLFCFKGRFLGETDTPSKSPIAPQADIDATTATVYRALGEFKGRCMPLLCVPAHDMDRPVHKARRIA